MKEYTTLLEEALEAWTYVREGVIDELRNIPERDLGFRPHPESRTVRELAQHIIQSGLLMSGELSRKDGDFRRKSYEALLREHGPGMAPKPAPERIAPRASVRRCDQCAVAAFKGISNTTMSRQFRENRRPNVRGVKPSSLTM